MDQIKPAFYLFTENPGMLAGIISSVLVAVAGAVSSFVAYQKKKLCFKASGKFLY